MIALALSLISLVVMIATGVVASSGTEDHLTFLGLGVQTTTAQVFVTGAIFGWLFLVAIWLLRIGLHRSSDRLAELAARRGRRTSDWFGFTAPDDPDSWDPWTEWASAEERATTLRNTAPGGPGPTRHDSGSPRRSDRRPDYTNRLTAPTPNQPGALPGDHPPGPLTSRLPRLAVNGGTQSPQISSGPSPMPSKNRRPDSERPGGDSGQ